MKEKEFDIAIREILQQAEEPVSPRVWEGVEAGLNRRRIFPVWAWGFTAVAAAAAIALVVFLQTPGVTEHSNPTISIVETPEATVLPIEEQVARNVSRLAHVPEPVIKEVPAVPAEEIPALEQEEEVQEFISTPLEEKVSTIAAVQPDTMPESAVEDNDALNKLAYSERKQKEPRGFSFTASGQMQGNTRGEVSYKGVNRAPGSMPLLAPVVDHGVFNEQPELNFSLPFSLGSGVKYHFNSRLALGTGIRYTYMSRTFLGCYNDISNNIHIDRLTDIDNHQHWLGVPLNFYFNIIDNGRWRLHTFVGGAGEFLVNNDYLIHYSPDIHFSQHGNRIQWSVAGGLGVEYRLTPTVGLFLDPSVRYYFGAENQPRSIRTIQPLRVEVEAGVRFSFGER